MTSFKSSELTELPVVENSQLFAQRVHSARYAPFHTVTTFLAHARILHHGCLALAVNYLSIGWCVQSPHNPNIRTACALCL